MMITIIMCNIHAYNYCGSVGNTQEGHACMFDSASCTIPILVITLYQPCHTGKRSRNHDCTKVMPSIIHTCTSIPYGHVINYVPFNSAALAASLWEKSKTGPVS